VMSKEGNGDVRVGFEYFVFYEKSRPKQR